MDMLTYYGYIKEPKYKMILPWLCRFNSQLDELEITILSTCSKEFGVCSKLQTILS